MPVQDTVTVGLPATVLWAEWRYSGTCQWSDTEPASGRYADSCPCTGASDTRIENQTGCLQTGGGMLYCLMQQTIVKTGGTGYQHPCR